MNDQQLESGSNSINLQAKGDICYAQNTIVLYSSEEIAEKLLNSVFGELPEITKKEIAKNQKSYFQVLSDTLHKIHKNGEELKKIVSSPDFQYISKKAAISASRSSSADLHKNLSHLVISRINNEDNDLKRIIYNEAITIVDKLTINQIKILTFNSLLKRTVLRNLNSFDDFIKDIKILIFPFIDCKITNTEIRHLAFSQCITIGTSKNTVLQIFHESYGHFFKSGENIMEIFKNNETIKKILSTIENTPFEIIDLTTVGLALAGVYYEQVVGKPINIDIWLNCLI